MTPKPVGARPGAEPGHLRIGQLLQGPYRGHFEAAGSQSTQTFCSVLGAGKLLRPSMSMCVREWGEPGPVGPAGRD